MAVTNGVCCVGKADGVVGLSEILPCPQNLATGIQRRFTALCQIIRGLPFCNLDKLNHAPADMRMTPEAGQRQAAPLRHLRSTYPKRSKAERSGCKVRSGRPTFASNRKPRITTNG
jgi:hypothetical protein